MLRVARSARAVKRIAIALCNGLQRTPAQAATSSRSMVNVPMYYRELAVARDKMVFELGELIGTFWGLTVGRER